MMLRDMKIGRRAGFIFAFLGVLVLAMGLASVFETKKMDRSTTAIRDTWLPAVLAMGEIGTQLGRARALTSNSLLLSNAEDHQRAVAEIEQVIARIAPQMQDYARTIINAQDRQLYDAFASAYQQYSSEQAQILKAVGESRVKDAERLLTGANARSADATMLALTNLIKFNSDGARAAADYSSDIANEALVVAIVALAIIMVTLIATATLLTRSIIQPLSQAVAVAERVSSGDLSQDIRFEGKDEPALLMGALQRMQHSLRDTLQRIANASDQLASASEELHAVTEDTSRGLHQQSNEIEQAATAVNQMTTAVEEVASNAVITSQASQGADQTTRQGQGQVAQALQSIQQLATDVTATSQEIGELANNVDEISRVLEVIGSIAGQTNLLALNAAIEAARAGDAGRGFAVVADEVRALAHRTQESTGEIAQMIDGIQSGTQRAVTAMHSSNQRTGSTLEVAQAAGEALEVIAREISAINERNLLIASASEQQAQVAREVDRNLMNIRDLSAQTSAGANQTSAASQDLSRLAVELNGMVGKFRF